MQTIDVLTKALLVLQCLWLAVANSQNLNITTSTENYLIQNKLKYAQNIEDYESQLAVFRSSYQKQVETINVQADLLEQRILEVDAKLNSSELLNDQAKYCVEKYREGIPKWPTVNATLTTCVASALNYLAIYTAPPESTKNTLGSYYKNTLETNLDYCLSNYPSLQSKYSTCVTQQITTANAYTKANQKTFATQMASAECSADCRIKTTLDCSFTGQYSAISAIGETTRLIDNCIAGLGYCSPNNLNSCPTYDVEMSSADYFKSTVQNSLYGLNENVSCVQLNFHN